jgi:hypothetical protein
MLGELPGLDSSGVRRDGGEVEEAYVRGARAEGVVEVEVRGVDGREGEGEAEVDGEGDEEREGEAGSERIHLKRVAATWKERAEDIVLRR